MAKMIISLRVNGEPYELAVDPWRSLLDVLRRDLNLTGSKAGCRQGECGACTVLVDGKAVNACLYLAAEANQREISTIEGLAPNGRSPHPVQEAFAQSGAADCPQCAPGLIMSAAALLAQNQAPSRDEISQALKGHVCTCGGPQKAPAAVELAARRLAPEKGE